MLRADAVVDAVEPGLQIGEDEVDHRHELFGHFGVAAFGNCMVVEAPLAQAGIAAPIVGDDQRAWHDGILDKAAQGIGAAVSGDGQPHSTGIGAILPLVLCVPGFRWRTSTAAATSVLWWMPRPSPRVLPPTHVHHGRVVKRTGDGSLIEFRSVVAAVRCAIEVQNGLVERNAGVPPERRIEFRVGIHLGDVVEEADGDLMGDGVNIAARLEGFCEPGAICLSEQAYWQVKGRLDLAVTDLGPKELKNIAEPVRVYSLEVGKPAQAKPATAAKPPEPKRRSAVALLAAGYALLLVLIAGGAWYFLPGIRTAPVASNAPPPLAASRLSIVVLPFANLSGDPAQDYLADALTDELTTALARLRDSFVIARNTAMTFKGKPVDAKAIGKDLGVRYVLEGSVLPSGNQVRVNAQLIDADSGAHLWADQFDTPRAGLLQMQDEIVALLAHAMDIQLPEAEAARLKRTPPANPDAEDLALQ